jgi:hypothetical protein
MLAQQLLLQVEQVSSANETIVIVVQRIKRAAQLQQEKGGAQKWGWLQAGFTAGRKLGVTEQQRSTRVMQFEQVGAGDETIMVVVQRIKQAAQLQQHNREPTNSRFSMVAKHVLCHPRA